MEDQGLRLANEFTWHQGPISLGSKGSSLHCSALWQLFISRPVQWATKLLSEHLTSELPIVLLELAFTPQAHLLRLSLPLESRSLWVLLVHLLISAFFVPLNSSCTPSHQEQLKGN